jgi:hypothetical protein
LALDWEYHTLNGLPNIVSFLSSRLPNVKLSALEPSEHSFKPIISFPIEGLQWIESMFTFETEFGSGKGILRLFEGKDSDWECYMMYTALQGLRGREEAVGPQRPHGGKNSLISGTTRGNRFEKRQQKVSFTDQEPDVLVIGAGELAYVCPKNYNPSFPGFYMDDPG